MSRTTKQKPAPGKEYWKSRLHRHGESPGRETKTLTHRKERRQEQAAIADSAQYDLDVLEDDVDWHVFEAEEDGRL